MEALGRLYRELLFLQGYVVDPGLLRELHRAPEAELVTAESGAGSSSPTPRRVFAASGRSYVGGRP